MFVGDVELPPSYEVGPVVAGDDLVGVAWVPHRTPFAEWLFWGPVGRWFRRGRLRSALRRVEARGYVLFRCARRRLDTTRPPTLAGGRRSGSSLRRSCSPVRT